MTAERSSPVAGIVLAAGASTRMGRNKRARQAVEAGLDA